MGEQWRFYGQTAICLPLPITRRHFPGQHYAFGVFIVLNLVLFLLIGVGQLAVYQAIHSTSSSLPTLDGAGSVFFFSFSSSEPLSHIEGNSCLHALVCVNPDLFAGSNVSHRRQQELSIARRLFLIVLSNFYCWCPMGVMGVLAARGVPIPGEVNVAAAIFIMPLNSALNPFLYTLNSALESRRKRLNQRTRQALLKSLQSDVTG
jgi:leucine-rich repeat-containing G protein-coupled receptor 8